MKNSNYPLYVIVMNTKTEKMSLKTVKDSLEFIDLESNPLYEVDSTYNNKKEASKVLKSTIEYFGY